MSDNNMNNGMDIDKLIEKSKSGEQLEYLYNIYENQYKEISSNIDKHTKIIQELLNSTRILENRELVKNNNLIVNVGNSIYSTVKIENFDNILVNVGSNYIIEKNIDEAKKIIDKKIKIFETEIKSLNKNRSDTRSILFKISYNLSMHSDQQHNEQSNEQHH